MRRCLPLVCMVALAGTLGCSRDGGGERHAHIRSELGGKWRLVSATVDGKPQDLGPDVVVLEFLPDGKWKEEVSRFGSVMRRQEGKYQPGEDRGTVHMESTREEGTPGYEVPSFASYKLEGDTLTVTYYEEEQAGVAQAALHFERVTKAPEKN